MAGEIYESLHFLSLVINRRQDIPLVRSKVKLLAKSAGFPRLAVTQLATTASEIARLLVRKCGGGSVNISLVHTLDVQSLNGLEMLFEGRKSCLNLNGSVVSDLSLSTVDTDFDSLVTIKGARRVLDKVVLAQGVQGLPIRIKCLKWGLALGWDKVQDIEAEIRKDLFVDSNESYFENLKIKHEEVRRLLKEKTARTKELDKVNAEILLMGKNLEDLAQERTMVEMSLRIADRIRNPAAVIGGITNQLLARKDHGKDDAKKLKALKAQAAKLEAAVLDFDLLSARKRNLFVRENLFLLVQEALSLCVTLSRKKINHSCVPPEADVLVQADRRTLIIAFLNIFRYAAHLTPIGGEMVIKVERIDGRPEVQLLFEKKNLQHRQGDSDVTLTLARQILSEHQAELTFLLDSKSLGKQKIEIIFPLVWQDRIDSPEKISLLGNSADSP